MIFNNFFPLLGEYQKRETFDDVEAKYSIYWIKRMIEDNSYTVNATDRSNFNNKGYAIFDCDRINDSAKRVMCDSMVGMLEVNNAAHCRSDNSGSLCNIYITKYRIGGNSAYKFKDTVKADTNYTVFNSGFQEYVRTLPDYVSGSLNYSRYRVLAEFHHTYPSGENDYYSYATIEVNR